MAVATPPDTNTIQPLAPVKIAPKTRKSPNSAESPHSSHARLIRFSAKATRALSNLRQYGRPRRRCPRNAQEARRSHLARSHHVDLSAQHFDDRRAHPPHADSRHEFNLRPDTTPIIELNCGIEPSTGKIGHPDRPRSDRYAASRPAWAAGRAVVPMRVASDLWFGITGRIARLQCRPVVGSSTLVQ